MKIKKGDTLYRGNESVTVEKVTWRYVYGDGERLDMAEWTTTPPKVQQVIPPEVSLLEGFRKKQIQCRRLRG